MRGDVIYALLVAAMFLGAISGCAPRPSGTQPNTSLPQAVTPSPASPEAVVAEDASLATTATDAAPSKATSPVRGAFRWDLTRVLAPGDVAEFHLDVTPEVSVESLSVSVAHTGDLELLSATPMPLGAVKSGDTQAAAIQVRANKPGRVELRASVEGRDASGAILFQVSYPLYLIIAKDRVLAGVDGFSALELADLERRRESGEVTDEDYERAKRRIHGGGAQEVITVTPPAS